jgi:hypothetical protein
MGSSPERPRPTVLKISALSPETQLLIRCARTHHDEAGRQQLRDLARGTISWDRLLDEAARHQIMPLVANSLGLVSDVIPSKLLERLAGYTQSHAMRNLKLTGVLAEVLDALDESDIVAFPYKGPALAVAAYGSVLLRSFADLDVLVQKREYLRAKAVLEDLGFVSASPFPSDRYYLLWKSAFRFDREDVSVDLQWGSTSMVALSIPLDEEFWRSGVQLQIAGQTVRAIAAEDLMLFLCAHGSRHEWDRLKWVCDVAELIRAQEHMDWASTLGRARQVGAMRVLRLGLILAEELLEARVPDEVFIEIQSDKTAMRLARDAARRLLLADPGPPLSVIAQHRFRLEMQTRWSDRMRYVVHQLVQPRIIDRDFVSLPRPLWILYPVIRVVRVAGKYAFGWLGEIAGRLSKKAKL